MQFPIYLDNNATTRVDPRVVETMLPYFTEQYGNASSQFHSFGTVAAKAVERARGEIAKLLGVLDIRDIAFTSGATESNNLALKGVLESTEMKNPHLIVSNIEHKCVLEAAKFLEKHGCSVTYLPVDRFGMITPESLSAAINERTVLASIMAVNNEIHTVNPLKELGAVCQQKGILFHVDAAQGVGKIPLDVEAMGIDLLSLSAHKFYGPKGVGALYARRTKELQGKRGVVRVAQQMHGGSHERNLRAGTLNVPGIVGLGAAAELCRAELETGTEINRILELRDHLISGIMGRLKEVYLNGHPTARHPGGANLSFAYVEGESMILKIKDVALSTGSACTDPSLKPSYVLEAIGVAAEVAHSSLRFCVGRFNTREEIDYTIDRVVKAVTELRELSPLYEMAQKGIDLKTIQWNDPHHH